MSTKQDRGAVGAAEVADWLGKVEVVDQAEGAGTGTQVLRNWRAG